jgi:outer membrane lipoprotein-sorting protein
MILVARDAKTSSRGEIALNFSENPLSLTGWSVTDAGGSKVTVRLEHLERSAPKPAPFFELKDPKMARGSGADRG